MKSFRKALAGLILLGFGVAGAEESPVELKRGTWAVFVEAAEILSASDVLVRTAPVGEVVRVRILRNEWAEVGSASPTLPGGKVKVTSLRPATAQEREKWTAAQSAHAARVAEDAAPLVSEPTEDQENVLEQEEVAATDLAAPQPAAAPSFPTPVVGWFSPGQDFAVTHAVMAPDGTPYLSGKIRPPLKLDGARGWAGPVPIPDETDGSALCFVARLSPSLAQIQDFVVFSRAELGDIRAMTPAPDGGGIWIAATEVAATIGGREAGKSHAMLLLLAADLKSCPRAIGLSHQVAHLAVDSKGRPMTITPVRGQSGGSVLTRYFSQGHFLRAWPDAPEGRTRRLKLDFSSPSLAGGPFALWSQRGETLPDFPTPIGPWGSPSTAGKPVSWTNVKDGKNPIRQADLKPEAIVLGKDGKIYIAGTIPFHMGFPDFDPFLLCFSPEGKLLWVNCFLTGLLSEPDQKIQDLAVDPASGDVIVCYWQHGNNRETLLLDPRGWLNKFTGTNGNIKITWVGRVGGATGVLRHSTYLYARMPDSKNPGWPDINSVTTRAVDVDRKSRVFAAGTTTISFPTTENAYLPAVSEYGGHPFFCVLKPDLSGPVYSTYLSHGQGGVDHLLLAGDGLAMAIGKHKTDGTVLAVDPGPLSWLSSTPPPGMSEAVFFALLPIPNEETGWDFR